VKVSYKLFILTGIIGRGGSPEPTIERERIDWFCNKKKQMTGLKKEQKQYLFHSETSKKGV